MAHAATLGRRSSDPIRDLQEQVNRMRVEGVDLVDLGMGNPELPRPHEFIHEMRRVLASPSRYTLRDGHVHYRQNLVEFETHKNGWSGCDVTVTDGASGGLSVLLNALAPGHVVAIGPSFPLYKKFAQGAGHTYACIADLDESELLANVEREADQHGMRAALVNIPRNPTGGVLKERTIHALRDICETYGSLAIWDAVYEGIGTETQFLKQLNYRNSAKVNSLSKLPAMPGLRIGWIALNTDADSDLVSQDGILTALHETGRTQGAQTEAQAALEHLPVDFRADWEPYLRAKEDFSHHVRAMGYDVLPSLGGCFVAFSHPSMSGSDLASRLLSTKESTPLATVPLDGFGLPQYVRAAFCTSEALNLERSYAALRRFSPRS